MTHTHISTLASMASLVRKLRDPDKPWVHLSSNQCGAPSMIVDASPAAHEGQGRSTTMSKFSHLLHSFRGPLLLNRSPTNTREATIDDASAGDTNSIRRTGHDKSLPGVSHAFRTRRMSLPGLCGEEFPNSNLSRMVRMLRGRGGP